MPCRCRDCISWYAFPSVAVDDWCFISWISLTIDYNAIGRTRYAKHHLLDIDGIIFCNAVNNDHQKTGKSETRGYSSRVRKTSHSQLSTSFVNLRHENTSSYHKEQTHISVLVTKKDFLISDKIPALSTYFLHTPPQ